MIVKKGYRDFTREVYKTIDMVARFSIREEDVLLSPPQSFYTIVDVNSRLKRTIATNVSLISLPHFEE